MSRDPLALLTDAQIKSLLRSSSARATALQDNVYYRLPPMTDQPSVANGIIEIPKGQRNKFEIDKASGLIRLDRYLSSSTHYPVDYGIIPQTLEEDGDPLDILVLVREPTFSGCLIHARVIGLLQMWEKGEDDMKVLAVPEKDPFFDGTNRFQDVPPAMLDEIEHFFNIYKQLEGGRVETLGWLPPSKALRVIARAQNTYDRARVMLAARANSSVKAPRSRPAAPGRTRPPTRTLAARKRTGR